MVIMMTSSNGDIFRVTGQWFLLGNHRSPVNSLHKGQWRGAFMFSLICVWINSSVNNREAGDLRRHRAHYDVIVMILMNYSDIMCDLMCLIIICCLVYKPDGKSILFESLIVMMSHKRHWVSNYRLFVQQFMRSHIKELSKSALLALCEGNSPVTGEFPTQWANNAEKASIQWRHNEQGDLIWWRYAWYTLWISIVNDI